VRQARSATAAAAQPGAAGPSVTGEGFRTARGDRHPNGPRPGEAGLGDAREGAA